MKLEETCKNTGPLQLQQVMQNAVYVDYVALGSARQHGFTASLRPGRDL